MDQLHTREKAASIPHRIFLGKPFLIVSAVILIYTLAGFFLAPYLINRQLTGFVSKDLGRFLSIGKVRLNPYTLTVEFSDLALTEADGSPLFSFQRFFANFELKSLLRWTWTFDEVSLNRPELHIKLDSDGVMNLTRLASDAAPKGPETEKASPKAAENEGLPRLYFKRVRLSDGHLRFIDLSDTTPAETDLNPINLEIKDFSTLPDTEGLQSFTAALPHNGSLKWVGTVSLQPMASEGKLELRDFKESIGWLFLQDELNLVRPNGTTNVDVNYFVSYKDNALQLVLDKINVLVSGLQLALKGENEAHLLALDQIRFSDGRFDLATRQLNVGHLDIQNGDVNVKVDRNGQLNWQRIVSEDQNQSNRSEPVESEASGIFQVQLEKIDVNNVALKVEDESRQSPMDLDIGRVGLSLSARIEQSVKAMQVLVDDIAVEIDKLALREAGQNENLFFLPKANVLAGPVDLVGRKVRVSELILADGQAALQLDKDGVFNFSKLKGSRNSSAGGNEAAGEKEPWSFELSKARLDQFELHFSDGRFSPAVVYNFKNINLGLTDFKNDPDASFDVDLSLNVKQGGKASINGKINPFKPSVRADVELAALALSPLQPYLESTTKVLLDSGGFSLKGDVRYGMTEAAALAFSGSASVDKLLVTLPQTKETLLSWKLLDTHGVRFATTPAGLTIDEVLLSEPFGKFVIRKDKSINFNDVLVDNEKNDKQSSGSRGLPVDIKRIRVNQGKLDFADLSLLFPFAAKIHGLKGAVTGVSSNPDSHASIDLDGRVQKYGSVEIKGELQPFNLRNDTDVVMNFRNVEMTELTPYSAEFAGRKITSGKLSLDLIYKIEKSQLKGENNIILDNFILGERVEAPKAVDLPLDLALALLKDADDRIDIGLPISGNLADPKFSYGHLVWKALANLVIKIAAAPFRALGALLGSENEELDTVVFAAGHSDLSPPEMEKLARLAEALGKRPKLTLEIQGRYDPEADGAALKEWALKNELGRRTGLTLELEQNPGPINFSDPATQQTLDALAVERLAPEKLAEIKAAYSMPTAYQQADGKSVEKKSSPAKTSPVPIAFYTIVYQELISREPLDENAFSDLSHQRSKAIANELTQTNEIQEDRISILDPMKADDIRNDSVTSKLKIAVSE